MTVGVQRHVSAALPPKQRNGTIIHEAGWAPRSVWTGAENLTPTGILSADRSALYQSLYRNSPFFGFLPIFNSPSCVTSFQLQIISRDVPRGELSYLAPLGSENISAPYFKQCFFRGGRVLPPQTESNTTPPSPKTEITNILFYILNFASIIQFKM